MSEDMSAAVAEAREEIVAMVREMGEALYVEHPANAWKREREVAIAGELADALIAAVRTDERAQLAVRATDQEIGMVMDARRTIEAAIDQVYGRNGSTFIRAAVVKALDSILAALTAARERAIEEAAALCDTELKTILPKSDAAAEVLHLAGRIRALAGQKGET